MEERLQKLLAQAGLCSRREAERWIDDGRVTVNGKKASVGDKADPRRDKIFVDGKPIGGAEEKVYLMLYKPRGYVTTMKDEHGRKTVADLVRGCGARVVPVGRLDYNSEGLLLLTNDGDLLNALTHPRHEVEKHYEVRVRGNRVFPQSDKAADIIDALFLWVKKAGVTIVHTTADELLIEDGVLTGVRAGHKTYKADRIIVATGGASYPQTGSTGDGYRFARQAGHTVVPANPSLVPLVEDGDTCQQLMGLSLRNVQLTVYENEKKLYSDFGEMLFTHFGLSGPLVLSASGAAARTQGVPGRDFRQASDRRGDYHHGRRVRPRGQPENHGVQKAAAPVFRR